MTTLPRYARRDVGRRVEAACASAQSVFSQHLLERAQRPLQRALVALDPLPEIAGLTDAVAHRSQRERARRDRGALDLVPGARRRHRGARFGPDGVDGGERRAGTVASRVDEDAPAAVGLDELLRQRVRVALDQHRARAVREAPDDVEVILAVERHDDVEPLRARRLDEARQTELREQIAHRQRGGAQDLLSVVARRIEIEHAQIGLVQLRHARGPHVRRDRVLIGEPQQRALVAGQRVVHRAGCLRAALLDGRRAPARRGIPSTRPSG